MTELIETIYTDGVFKPLKPVHLADNSRALIFINPMISKKTKGILKECDIEKIIEAIEDESLF